jgi:hypothetical protein
VAYRPATGPVANRPFRIRTYPGGSKGRRSLAAVPRRCIRDYFLG